MAPTEGPRTRRRAAELAAMTNTSAGNTQRPNEDDDAGRAPQSYATVAARPASRPTSPTSSEDEVSRIRLPGTLRESPPHLTLPGPPEPEQENGDSHQDTPSYHRRASRIPRYTPSVDAGWETVNLRRARSHDSALADAPAHSRNVTFTSTNRFGQLPEQDAPSSAVPSRRNVNENLPKSRDNVIEQAERNLTNEE
ncbi:hypothetical protein CVT24_012652 [Panaeolus cyanescens]|uniref:Uncharacterized protein n=1 Tax=Panaeolus cyanescens TaxID=181874 RepID=A0A409WKW0_9AGAR|nr:hypothetical protein CVT24_012652 [Panaeolus cyanescens]